MTEADLNNQAVHTATAMRECDRDITLSSASARGLSLVVVRNVTLGEWDGPSKGSARRAAAKMALAFLAENGIPVPQG